MRSLFIPALLSTFLSILFYQNISINYFPINNIEKKNLNKFTFLFTDYITKKEIRLVVETSLAKIYTPIWYLEKIKTVNGECTMLNIMSNIIFVDGSPEDIIHKIIYPNSNSVGNFVKNGSSWTNSIYIEDIVNQKINLTYNGIDNTPLPLLNKSAKYNLYQGISNTGIEINITLDADGSSQISKSEHEKKNRELFVKYITSLYNKEGTYSYKKPISVEKLKLKIANDTLKNKDGVDEVLQIILKNKNVLNNNEAFNEFVLIAARYHDINKFSFSTHEEWSIPRNIIRDSLLKIIDDRRQLLEGK